MAKANPSLVSSQVRHRNAAEMRADSRAHDDIGVTGISDHDLSVLVKLSGFWQVISLSDLTFSQTSDENHFSVPGGLEYFSLRKCADVQLLVCVSDVPASGDHLVVNKCQHGLHAKYVVS